MVDDLPGGDEICECVFVSYSCACVCECVHASVKSNVCVPAAVLLGREA